MNVSLKGKYQRQVFERDPLWEKNGASMFCGKAKEDYSGAPSMGKVKSGERNRKN